MDDSRLSASAAGLARAHLAGRRFLDSWAKTIENEPNKGYHGINLLDIQIGAWGFILLDLTIDGAYLRIAIMEVSHLYKYGERSLLSVERDHDWTLCALWGLIKNGR